MATRGVVAMGSTLGLEWVFAGDGLGRSAQDALIAMLLGAVVGMIGSMGLSSGPARTRAATAALFPLSIGVGMVVGAAVASNPDLLLGVFVVVLFAAVYVRRFGQQFFFAGFMIWMGYFFASFLGASFGQLPWLILYTVVASGWVLLLSQTVLRENPTRTLRHTLKAFTVRAEALADAAGDVLDDRRGARRRLVRHQRRMNETALMAEGQLSDQAALPAGWSAPQLRRWLTDAELAVDEIAAGSAALASGRPDRALAAAAVAMLRRLGRGEPDTARDAADRLVTGCGSFGENGGHAARRLADAVRAYARSTAPWSQPPRPDDPADGQDFTPSVTMTMGRLPNSNAVARDVRPRSAGWNPLARLPMTTRQAIQVAVAGGLAIAAGHALSERRYYWAVIAAFVAFTGTATRGETLIKAWNRVLGTAAGLILAILLANATAGNTDAVLAVILASMFLGFYLLQVSYGFLIFFITIVVAQLYSVLHEFSDQLLVLRLEETAIGAAIGILVALVILPVSTTDTSRAARDNVHSALRDLLAATADRLATGAVGDDLDGLARSVDSALYQLTQILQPLTRPLALRGDADRIRRRLALYQLVPVNARAVAGAARTPGWTRSAALAEVCRSVARAAEVLPDPRGTGVEDALQAAQDALDRARDREPGHPLVAPLSRLVAVLRRLADGSTSHERGRRRGRVPVGVGAGQDGEDEP